jgi:hypothetical protein
LNVVVTLIAGPSIILKGLNPWNKTIDDVTQGLRRRRELLEGEAMHADRMLNHADRVDRQRGRYVAAYTCMAWLINHTFPPLQLIDTEIFWQCFLMKIVRPNMRIVLGFFLQTTTRVLGFSIARNYSTGHSTPPVDFFGSTANVSQYSLLLYRGRCNEVMNIS